MAKREYRGAGAEVTREASLTSQGSEQIAQLRLSSRWPASAPGRSPGLLALQFFATATDHTGLTDKFTVGSHLSEMSVIKGKVDDFSARSRLTASTTSKLNIVLDELISDIINFGYADDAEHEIEICLELVGHRLVVTIADDGIPFNPLTVKPPDTSAPLSEREVGGLGIHLVRNLVDEATYQRRVNRNVLTLVIQLSPQHPAPVE